MIGRVAVVSILVGLFVACAPQSQANNNVYVSRFWHNHQPLYWPEWNSNGSQTERGQYAWDSIVLKPNQNYGGLSPKYHPENNLTDIFGLDDRRNAYQSRPKDALSSIGQNGGFAISYSGSLIDNVRNLAANNQLGYGDGWWNGNREARGWKTSGNSPRLDLVGFTYHHSLAPLLPKSVFRKEVQIFKQAWWKAWNGQSDLSDHSKGFFPTEMAYTRDLIDVLVDEGYEWVIVASHHLSRTCPTYNDQANPEGTYNIYSSPPNKADQLGPSPTSGWWYGEPNPGNAAWNVAPYAYQLHRVKYVNPATGAEKSMIAVPSDDVLSYRYGYANEGISKIQSYISPHATDPNRPVIVMPSTDGDNAWGGGFSSWMEATPQFFGESAGAGYQITAVQDMVNSKPPPAGTYAHIEDGAWIFPEMCYGSPNFMKWIEPPLRNSTATNTYPGTIAEFETPGFSLKFYSYAPLMAGANWCETAEQIMIDEGGTVDAWKIQAPYDWDGTWTSPNVVELAWHIYLMGLDSGFNYYGGLGNDDEVKPSLAAHRAIKKLESYLPSRLNNDRTPPTVLKPQRFPYNPGAYTFGWFNRIPEGDQRFLKKMPSEFYVWTHAYDVSGITSVSLKVRKDNDGVRSLANNHNVTYAGGSDVGQWVTIPMNKRTLPKTRDALNALANNPGEIDYFLPSPEVADYYFTKVTSQNMPTFRGSLLDYYVEAVDTRGNIHRSEIQHVYVEDDGEGSPTSSATFSSDPRDCAPLVVSFNAEYGPLQGVSPVYQQISFDGGSTWSRSLMTSTAANQWVATNSVPDNAPGALVWFENSDGSSIDSNNGANWQTTIRDCDAPTGPSAVAFDPVAPNSCDPVTIIYSPNAGPLQTATQVFIHVGHNNWQDVIEPNPQMTRTGPNQWEYVYELPLGTRVINVVFNDGHDIWDNNNTTNWSVDVTGCNPLPTTYIAVTNPLHGSATTSATISVSGISSGLVGEIWWTNTLSSAAGSIAVSPEWTATEIGLSVGTNLIVFSGTNDAMTGTATNAADSASDSAYDDGWASSDNGGTGLGAWILNALPPENSGHFMGDSTNIAIGPKAWGMYANSGSLSEAIRPFAQPLTAGDTFSVRMENGFLQGGAGTGVALQNAEGVTLWEFYFNGGDTNYSRSGGTTDIPWTDGGLDISFALTAQSAYEVSITPIGGSTRTYSGTFDDGEEIVRFRAWNYNNGSGSDHDYFINDLTLTSPAPGDSLTYTTVVVIVRNSGSGSADSNQDGLPDSWYLRYNLDPSGPSVADEDWDDDGFTNLQEHWLGTDPQVQASALILESLVDPSGGQPQVTWQSVGGRRYRVEYSDSLTDPEGGFQELLIVDENASLGLATNRTVIDTTVTPGVSGRHYRVKFMSLTP